MISHRVREDLLVGVNSSSFFLAAAAFFLGDSIFSSSSDFSGVTASSVFSVTSVD